MGPDDFAVRVGLAARLDGVAAHPADPAPRLTAHLWRLTTAWECLDVVAVQRQLRALDLLAAETGTARYAFFAAARRAMHALVTGDLDGAATLTATARTQQDNIASGAVIGNVRWLVLIRRQNMKKIQVTTHISRRSLINQQPGRRFVPLAGPAGHLKHHPPEAAWPAHHRSARDSEAEVDERSLRRPSRPGVGQLSRTQVAHAHSDHHVKSGGRGLGQVPLPIGVHQRGQPPAVRRAGSLLVTT